MQEYEKKRFDSHFLIDLTIEGVPIEDAIREIFWKPGWEGEANVAL